MFRMTFLIEHGRKSIGLINRQNNVKIGVDEQRAFGGWRSCFVHCNIIWTWLVFVASRRTRLVLLTFCCYLYTAKRSIFSASKVLLRACVRMSLVLTFSSCQRARAGPVLRSRGGKAALCPKRFLLKARTGSKAVNTHGNTHQYILTHACTHTHTIRQYFSLSAAHPKRTKCLKWTLIHKAHLHTSTHTMLITQVSCLCLPFSKAIETWGWRTQPWSNNVELGLQTWQMKATHSVKQCGV